MSVCMCVSHLYFFVGGIHFSYTEVGGTNIFHKKVGDKHFDTRGGGKHFLLEMVVVMMMLMLIVKHMFCRACAC